MSHFTALNSQSNRMELEDFNRRVLTCQDQAFTLAMLLLGDEKLACSAVTEAFRQAYLRPANASSFDLAILGAVIKSCLRRRDPLGPEPIRGSISALTKEEKLALILVDCIGMNYLQAAAVLECPLDLVQKSLARARYRVHAALPKNGNHGEKI